MSSDVIVIGAGYAGLTVAAILAHHGVDVNVLETTGHIGGRATFDRKDGFLVDYGIHANRYGSQGAAASALREIGHEIEFLPMGKPLFYQEGEFINLPSDVTDLLKSGFLPLLDKMLIAFDLIKLILSRPSKNSDVPLKDAIWGMKREHVRNSFNTISGLGLLSPDISQTSAGEFGIFLKKALRSKRSVAYPRGGTSQIIEALEKKIEESGRISLNSRVKSLMLDSGRVNGALVRDEILECQAAVFAAPVQKLKEVMPKGEISEDFLSSCASIIPTAGLSIDLCLRDRVSDIDGLVVTPEPLTWGQFTSNIDRETAPEGKQLATWYYPLSVDSMEDHDKVEEAERALIGLLEEMFPGICDMIEWQRSLALDMVDGFEPRVGQTSKDRPGVGSTGVENLFLAGDVISAPGSGGDVAFNSAVEAAKMVMSYLS